MRLRFEVEEQQQVEQLFEAVGKLGIALRLEMVRSQTIEVAIKRGEVGAILADLQGHHGERQRIGTRRLETVECLEIIVDPAGSEQRLGERLVRGGVTRAER